MNNHVFRRSPPSWRSADRFRPAATCQLARLRSGVSLVELLVTITMIALLMSLLLPVLGMARESVRRTYCSNNIRELAKGLISHDTARSGLPGWRNAVDGYTDVKLAAGAPSLAYVSWTVSVLPFIGENDLADWYREFTSGVPVDDVTRKRVDVFVCPSADGVTRSALCYMGNGGTGAETLIPETPPQQYRGDGAMLDVVGHGGYAAGRWSLEQIALGDGGAGTILLAERCGLDAPRDVSWAAFALPTIAGERHQFETTHVVLHPPALASGQRPPPEARVINPKAETLPAPSNDWAWRYPSSRHKGGAVAAFGDGHVKFLSEKIAPWVYCQLMTSDKKYRSARAASWEHYPLNGDWVPYILDDADIPR